MNIQLDETMKVFDSSDLLTLDEVTDLISIVEKNIENVFIDLKSFDELMSLQVSLESLYRVIGNAMSRAIRRTDRRVLRDRRHRPGTTLENTLLSKCLEFACDINQVKHFIEYSIKRECYNFSLDVKTTEAAYKYLSFIKDFCEIEWIFNKLQDYSHVYQLRLDMLDLLRAYGLAKIKEIHSADAFFDTYNRVCPYLGISLRLVLIRSWLRLCLAKEDVLKVYKSFALYKSPLDEDDEKLLMYVNSKWMKIAKVHSIYNVLNYKEFRFWHQDYIEPSLVVFLIKNLIKKENDIEKVKDIFMSIRSDRAQLIYDFTNYDGLWMMYHEYILSLLAKKWISLISNDKEIYEAQDYLGGRYDLSFEYTNYYIRVKLIKKMLNRKGILNEIDDELNFIIRSHTSSYTDQMSLYRGIFFKYYIKNNNDLQKINELATYITDDRYNHYPYGRRLLEKLRRKIKYIESSPAN